MGIIGWLVIGSLAGWLAGAVTGSRRGGCIWNIVIGTLGALVGGLIYNAATKTRYVYDFSLRSLGIATLGAVVLLVVANLATPRRLRR